MHKESKGRMPPAMTAPVDPEEFKFCCALMSAAYSGQMPTSSPTSQSACIEGIGEVFLADTPMNRAMLAVRDHFRDTGSVARHDEFMATACRLTFFVDFVRLSIKKKDPRIEAFVDVQNGQMTGMGDALLEAAATLRLRWHGFSCNELFAKAAQRMSTIEKSVDCFLT